MNSVIGIVMIAAACAALGGLIAWLWVSKAAAGLGAERDHFKESFRAAILDLETASQEREDARLIIAGLNAQHVAREESFLAQIKTLNEAKDALSAQFTEIGARLLSDAQSQFLNRAEERFKQSSELTGEGIKALLSPVHERLTRYEEAVSKVESERRDAFGELRGLMDAMRVGQEAVKTEAARLGNSLRNAPKARGRWGEQQLRNVLETCGLSSYADFQTEVSVEHEEGRLRPDVIIRVPGGKALIIDAKVSLNAYQDAYESLEEDDRRASLSAHAAAMKAHVNSLGQKAYWNQFEDAPDYVIMFVPGEHFLSAALEHDPSLWDFAFAKRVLLATPTNLIAIARTVAAVWRQEKMADEAREIAALGKELYARISTMGSHVTRLGRNLDTAVSAYNAFVGSLETKVLTQAQRFEQLSIDTGNSRIEDMPTIDQTIRPLVKLVATSEGDEPLVKQD
jgi:DNA recombination protein RmuC